MYAAKIQLGWINKVFKGETPGDIIKEVENYQDFDCLMRMGRENEDSKGQKELDKLQIFLNKYRDGELTIEDIKTLDIHLNLGGIICHGIANDEDEIAKLEKGMD